MNNLQNGFHQEPEVHDPLVKDPQAPNALANDRVYYATGVLLDAEDFQAEQLYHRSRLALALAYLHGSGTVAGLEVLWQKKPDSAEELIVKPGIAIDRLGRLIEVPQQVCIRLERWLKNQQTNSSSIKTYTNGPKTWLLADVFLRFVAAPAGKTPAFAAGPFDALDAVTPARIRDGYELKLILRQEKDPLLPKNPWDKLAQTEDIQKRREELHKTIFQAWEEGTVKSNQNGLVPLQEHISDQNPTSLFLARVEIPLKQDDSKKFVRNKDQVVIVNNTARSFVYTVGALASWLKV